MPKYLLAYHAGSDPEDADVQAIIQDTRVIAGAHTKVAEIAAFIRANRATLADPRVSVGTWFNPEDGLTYLDISVALGSRAEAEALAKSFDQIAMFDLATLSTIDTGGSGSELPAGAPPPSRRLPRQRFRFKLRL